MSFGLVIDRSSLCSFVSLHFVGELSMSAVERIKERVSQSKKAAADKIAAAKRAFFGLAIKHAEKPGTAVTEDEEQLIAELVEQGVIKEQDIDAVFKAAEDLKTAIANSEAPRADVEAATAEFVRIRDKRMEDLANARRAITAAQEANAFRTAEGQRAQAILYEHPELAPMAAGRSFKLSRLPEDATA
jgi:hypothetical protein